MREGQLKMLEGQVGYREDPSLGSCAAQELLVDTEGGTKILGLHQDLQACAADGVGAAQHCMRSAMSSCHAASGPCGRAG